MNETEADKQIRLCQLEKAMQSWADTHGYDLNSKFWDILRQSHLSRANVAGASEVVSREETTKRHDPEAGTQVRLRELARTLFHKEGAVEIDPEAPVSLSEDGGAYVQCWVWVDDPEADHA